MQMNNLQVNYNSWMKEDPSSQASTYFEWCFEQRCQGISQGEKVLNEWRTRKESYCSFIRTTIYDFQHYSRHDASHSINILNYVEMVLGRKRVQMLSVADLWAMLECAYFHDIGMTITYKQMVELWRDDRFKQFLNQKVASDDIDLKKAYEYYKRIDNLINERPEEEGLEGSMTDDFMDSWPVELQRYVQLLMTDYIRRHHSMRSKEKMQEINAKLHLSAFVSFIPERLYNIVAEIAFLHNENFEDIYKNLNYSEIGFDTERLHPQFIAAMLRLGDLLDMDNNRFDQKAIDHFGSLPHSSSLHLKKHKSLAHFEITNRLIEARAVSDEEEVCRLTSGWFQMLDREVKCLICDWNRLVPENLRGCLMQRCKLEVYYGDRPYITDLMQSYEIDKKRLLHLMAGFNLYSSTMDCLREYIQNALDACKMDIWMGLKEEQITYKNSEQMEVTMVCPYDLEKRVFEEYKIEIGAWLDMENQQVSIRIEDWGIGMETECIDGLAVVGKSWKQRAVYREQIMNMPDWLKPTGGFGIGLLSAFMLTEEVVIYSKSDKETEGYEVHLLSPQRGGSVIKQRWNCGTARRSGTRVLFNVKLSDIYEYVRTAELLDIGELMGKKSDITERESGKERDSEILHDSISLKIDSCTEKADFSTNNIIKGVYRFLEYYVRKNVPNTLVPICICSDRKKGDKQCRNEVIYTYRSPFASEKGGFGYITGDGKENGWNQWIESEVKGKKYLYNISQDLTFRIWDRQDNVSVCIMSFPYQLKGLDKTKRELLNPICYRNVRVWNGASQAVNIQRADFLSVCIDVMGKSAEEVLDVQRNNFMKDFHIENMVNTYQILYVESMIKFLQKKDDMPYEMNYEEKLCLSMIDMALLAIKLLDKEKAEEIINLWEKRHYEPACIRMNLVSDRQIKNEVIATEDVLQGLLDLLSVEKQSEDQPVYTFFSIPIQDSREEDSFSLNLQTESVDKRIQPLYRQLIEDGTRLYVYPPICDMLQKMSRYTESQEIMIDEDEESRVYLAVKNLRKSRKYQPQKKISKEEFFREAFRFASNKQYVAQNVSCEPDEYDALKVRCLPGEILEEGLNNEYLIAPVSYELFRKILELAQVDPSEMEEEKNSKDEKNSKEEKNNKDEKNSRDEKNSKDDEEIKKYHVSKWFKKQLFIDAVQKSSEYKFLIKWVYENQCADSESRLSLEKVNEKYEHMLEEMYKYKFFCEQHGINDIT